MFRTVTVYQGERVSVSENWMVVSGQDGEHRLSPRQSVSFPRQS